MTSTSTRAAGTRFVGACAEAGGCWDSIENDVQAARKQIEATPRATFCFMKPTLPRISSLSSRPQVTYAQSPTLVPFLYIFHRFWMSGQQYGNYPGTCLSSLISARQCDHS